METIKILKYGLLLLMASASLSCGLTTIERETSIEGTVKLGTGELVENYPLAIVVTKGALYGIQSPISEAEIRTDKKGFFSYQAKHKNGLSYQLHWPYEFQIQGQAYSVDTLQVDILGVNPTNQPNYRFDGYIVSGRDYRIKVFLKKT